MLDTRHSLFTVISTNKSDVSSYGVEHLQKKRRLNLFAGKFKEKKLYLAVFSL